MRPIHVVQLDKPRPALILTHGAMRECVEQITVAPITSRPSGLESEVGVGARDGLDQASVVSLDTMRTVRRTAIGRQIGWLLDKQEPALAAAIAYAFELEGTEGG